MSIAARRRPGRPPKDIPTIDWKVRIPVPLATKVDVLLLDPVTGRTRHGLRSAFVTRLLESWLARHGMTVPDDLKGGDTSGQEEG